MDEGKEGRMGTKTHFEIAPKSNLEMANSLLGEFFNIFFFNIYKAITNIGESDCL